MKKSLRIILTCLVLLMVQVCLAQNDDSLSDIRNYADCSNALWISTLKPFGPTCAPVGFGSILEISNNSIRDPMFFEIEHNTVWYKFKAERTGLMTLNIIPINPADDYDFSIYKFTGTDFCQNVINKINKPVRTNISRNDLTGKGITGLSLDAKNEFKEAGPGTPFSKALQVQKGEIYCMVVDNVYDGGSGHTIQFDYFALDGTKELYGKVTDETTGLPLSAEVIVSDLETGDTIAVAKTDAKTGKYTLKLPAGTDLNKKVYVTIYNDNYFFSDNEVTLSDIQYKTTEQNVTKVSKIQAGKSYKIKNINFYKDSPSFYPSSEHILIQLYKLMVANPNMFIRIEGYINGCFAEPEKIRLLSEARAYTIYNYLVKKGISPERMSTIGYGCSKMIYPDPKNAEEEKENRRVEIKIVKM